VSGEHLPRYLRIARLIGTDQAKGSQREEKQEGAETGQECPVRAQMEACSFVSLPEL